MTGWKLFNFGKRKEFSKIQDIQDIVSMIEPDDLVIDGGANVGEVTQLLRQRGAIVHAFEPNSFAFSELENRFKNDNKVCTHNKALWINNEDVRLFLHELSDDDELTYSTGSSLNSAKPNVRTDKFQSVQACDIAEFVFSLEERVRFFKLDVEGAEIEIVNHLLNTGALSQIDFLAVETHEKKFPKLREPTQEMKKAVEKKGFTNVNWNWI